MLLEFQERMIKVEEWWNSVLKRDCVWVIHTFSRGVYHHVVLCKVRLLGAWIKRRELVVGARRIRSEKPGKISAENYMLDFLRGTE